MEDDGRPDLARTVQICLAKQSADGQVDVDNGRAFANAVLEFTEVGHRSPICHEHCITDMSESEVHFHSNILGLTEQIMQQLI